MAVDKGSQDRSRRTSATAVLRRESPPMERGARLAEAPRWNPKGLHWCSAAADSPFGFGRRRMPGRGRCSPKRRRPANARAAAPRHTLSRLAAGGGWLHCRDDARAERREAVVRHRAVSCVGHRAPGLPRSGSSARAHPRDRIRPQACARSSHDVAFRPVGLRRQTLDLAHRVGSPGFGDWRSRRLARDEPGTSDASSLTPRVWWPLQRQCRCAAAAGPVGASCLLFAASGRLGRAPRSA